MGKLVDLTGKRFGRLVVIRRADKKTGKDVLWECKCDCGSENILVQGNNLKSGNTNSCGCFKRESTSKRCLVDLSGKRFKRLVVLKRSDKVNKQGKKEYWECRCDCGKIVTVRSRALTSGKTKSCGCYGREMLQKPLPKHNMARERPYHIWQGMISRCYNKNNIGYYNYGGRGITVCDKWRTFEGFWDDMKKGYNNNLTIDRINNNNGYCKENCRWATTGQQSLNKRSNRRFFYNGEHLTVTELAIKYKIRRESVYNRIRRGWSIKEAIEKPLRNYRA